MSPSGAPGFDAPEAETDHGATLDRWDVAILAELQADARLTNTELAARIGLQLAQDGHVPAVERGAVVGFGLGRVEAGGTRGTQGFPGSQHSWRTSLS